MTVGAVYFYSPVLGSHADSATSSDTTEITVDVEPVASITLDTNNVNFNVIPTDTGVFSSKPIIATVNTNSTGGYELYFSSIDNATNMVHTNTSITDVIASDFNGTVTSSTMAKNKWGYSLDNTDFSKIPTLATQVKIKDLDHYPSVAEKNTTVYIGTKVASDLMTGSYQKNVLFSVIAHDTPIPPTMQTFNCSYLANVDSSATLTDTRDDNTYTVKKFADGRCWMTENLRIQDKVLTSDDSDLVSGTTYTIPASELSNFATERGIDHSAAYVNDARGGFYNFYTATAGTGGTSLTSGNAPSSICPKGWHLPTVTEYQTFYNSYDTDEAAFLAAGFNLFSDVYDGVLYDPGLGFYWESTVIDANHAYNLFLDSVSRGYPDDEDTKYPGYAVRCIAN